MGSAPVMDGRAWVMLIALSLCWGCSFLFNALGLQGFPPLTLVFLRLLVAALAMWAVVALLRLPVPRGARIWWLLIGMALLNNVVPFSLIVWGQTRIDSGLASILNASTPLWTVIVAHLTTTNEKLTANRLLGSVVGIAGVAVMLGAGGIDFSGDGMVWGELAVLGGALSYAFSTIVARRMAGTGAPLSLASGQVAVAAVIMLPATLILDQPWTLPAPGSDALLAVLGIGLISTALAYWLYFMIMQRAGATNVVLVTLLIPVTALLLGSLILGEALEPRQLLGMALIGCGLIAIDGRLLRRLRVRAG